MSNFIFFFPGFQEIPDLPRKTSPTTTTLKPQRGLTKIPPFLFSSMSPSTLSPPDPNLFFPPNGIFPALATLKPVPSQTISIENSTQPNNKTFSKPLQDESRTILCGKPAFCTNGVYQECGNVSISDCERCDVGLAATFLFFFVCLGLAIILGNLLIILVSYRRHKRGKADKMDYCKLSLALADMLTGVNILTVIVYNFSWTIHATSSELQQYVMESSRTPAAFFGGVLYLFGFTASVFHLSLMAGFRLSAVLLPLQFKFMRNKTLGCFLGLVWIMSAVAATSPGWLSEQVFFLYQVSILLFFPSVNDEADLSSALGILTVFYIFPYVMMTSFSIATAIAIRCRQNSKSKAFSSQKKTQLAAKKELFVFFTVLIMQVAFTLVIIPTIVVVALFYAGNLQCDTLATPYVVSIYFSMTNSLINVFIYNIREKAFRAETKKLLWSCIPERLRQHTVSTSSHSPGSTNPGKSANAPPNSQNNNTRSKILSSSTDNQL